MTAPAFDFADFDPEVRVQDDLYRHVNGRWLRDTEIPADKPLTGAFVDLRDQAEIAVRDIITTLESGEPGSDEAKIADLYASFMDEEAVEAAGAGPLLPLFAEIDEVSDPEQLAGLLGRFTRRAINGLVGVDTESDPGDPNRYVMFAGQGGIGLPDEAYYRLEEHAAIRDAVPGPPGAVLRAGRGGRRGRAGRADLRPGDRHRRHALGQGQGAATCG